MTNGTEPEIRDAIMKEIKEYTWTTILSEAISTGVYFIITLMMICGIQCDLRGLMIPYLVIQMLYIILAIIMGIAVTVVLFYFNLVMGIVAAAVVLILAFLFVYFTFRIRGDPTFVPVSCNIFVRFQNFTLKVLFYFFS